MEETILKFLKNIRLDLGVTAKFRVAHFLSIEIAKVRKEERERARKIIEEMEAKDERGYWVSDYWKQEALKKLNETL